MKTFGVIIVLFICACSETQFNTNRQGATVKSAQTQVDESLDTLAKSTQEEDIADKFSAEMPAVDKATNLLITNDLENKEIKQYTNDKELFLVWDLALVSGATYRVILFHSDGCSGTAIDEFVTSSHSAPYQTEREGPLSFHVVLQVGSETHTPSKCSNTVILDFTPPTAPQNVEDGSYLADSLDQTPELSWEASRDIEKRHRSLFSGGRELRQC